VQNLAWNVSTVDFLFIFIFFVIGAESGLECLYCRSLTSLSHTHTHTHTHTCQRFRSDLQRFRSDLRRFMLDLQRFRLDLEISGISTTDKHSPHNGRLCGAESGLECLYCRFFIFPFFFSGAESGLECLSCRFFNFFSILFLSVVQNLAWNVFTVDLSVAVVVVECDQTQELHRGNLEQRFGVSAQVLD